MVAEEREGNKRGGEIQPFPLLDTLIEVLQRHLHACSLPAHVLNVVRLVEYHRGTLEVNGHGVPDQRVHQVIVRAEYDCCLLCQCPRRKVGTAPDPPVKESRSEHRSPLCPSLSPSLPQPSSAHPSLHPSVLLSLHPTPLDLPGVGRHAVE